MSLRLKRLTPKTRRRIVRQQKAIAEAVTNELAPSETMFWLNDDLTSRIRFIRFTYDFTVKNPRFHRQVIGFTE